MSTDLVARLPLNSSEQSPIVNFAEHLQTALRIRLVEERLLELFSQGKLNGTVHTCIGQEWIGVAISAACSVADSLFSTHRGHGHFLARTGDVRGLIAEVMGRASGVCGGVGGTQHLHSPEYFSNGIQGGMVPVAAGRALAHKLAGSGNVAVVFIGDGSWGEGIVYETLNIAARWGLPLLIVCENNRYAQSTPAERTTAGSIEGRAAAFGIDYHFADTWDVNGLFATAEEAVSCVRREVRPVLLQVDTYRLKAHSKGDDNRAESEIGAYERADFLSQLLKNPDAATARTVAELRREIDDAVTDALASPPCRYVPRPSKIDVAVEWSRLPGQERQRHIDRVHQGLQEIFAGDRPAFLLGEDIEAPYGGAFKATRSLSEEFPDLVRSTPISEAAIIGVATGVALGGRMAIAEIMFGDFLTLGFDQIFQHASKFCEIYGTGVDVPLIVRTPMGGRRGYGPTHSQSIEKFFLGIPNLDVIALNQRFDPSELYRNLAREIRIPTLVIENKVLYTRFSKDDAPPGYTAERSDEKFPTIRLRPKAGRATVTILCYGGVLEVVEDSLDDLFSDAEILCEVIVPTKIHPFNSRPLKESLARTGRLLTIEEGVGIAGFGGEALARLFEEGVRPSWFRRISFDGIIPADFSREQDLLPSKRHILEALDGLRGM